ncbi:zinc finger, CCHC-type containing protein [Tanacetum coccineum]
MVVAMKYMASNFVKIEKFEGVDFQRWQKKMHFLLSSMSMVYVPTTPMPEDEGLILNGMSDSLFDIYQNFESSKELWDTLEAKYMVEDASSKKFLVSNFTNYKMTDSRLVLEQYNELLGILGRFTQHKINMDESIQEELTLVELGSHLRIKESLRAHDNDKPKGNNVVGPLVVNMVEHNNSPVAMKIGCRKPGHLKKDCKASNIGNKDNGSGTKGSVDGSSNSLKGHNMFNKSLQVYYVTYVSEAYFVQDDDVAWWLDLGATVHMCKDRYWFKTYESLNDGSILHMGNESTTLMQRHGCVDLRLMIISDNISSVFMSTSKLNNSIIWHARLGHVYFKRMHDMSKDGLIPAFDMDTEKCKTCMLTKITKKPFQNVKRETEVLELIHSDLCDMHATPSLGNKNYFVTFIDDAFRFCYVYLLHSKDEALYKFKVFKTEVELQQGSLIKRFRIDRGGEYIDTLNFSSGWAKSRVTDEVVQQPKPKLRKSKRHRTPKDFRPEFQLYLIEGTRDENEAINDEMDSIMGNNTWVLIDLPPGYKPLGCKWIFKRKLKVDETVEKFKARLVIQSFKQKSGIDYFDTYALVACISTIRLLIAMASIHSLIIHQINVKTTFLNGELDEEVYMNQPQGFIMPGNENKVCKLIKTLYGMKQEPKQWHQKFDEVVLSNGYLLNQADKFHVDLTKEFLSSRFSLKDMGEADVILGIRIKHESNGIAISQFHYIEKVLKKFNYFNCTPVSTPMDTSEKLMPNNGQVVSQLEYSRVFGCLMYAMTCTRPDIAFVVGKLSRHTSNPVLKGYTDASWIQAILALVIIRSSSGWVFLLGGGAISWASKKQTCITGSTIEYEFMALSGASKKAEWLKNLLLEIPLWVKPIAPICIRCDSTAALAKAYRHTVNGKLLTLGTEAHVHIIPRMCLEPVEKEDEVVNFLMVNFFKKVLSRSMIKRNHLRKC